VLHDISEKSTLPVRQFITADREDEQVPDKSMFKRCFLVGLEGDADLTGDGYITGSELGMYLSDKVVNYTHRQQHPQYGKINNPNLDRGDFIFALKVPSQPSTQISAAPSPSLEAEKQRLAEDRSRLEQERQELEQLKMEIERKKLEAEWKRLEADQQKIDKEKKKLAYIPKTPTIARVTLREKPMKNLREKRLKDMLASYGFFDSSRNPHGSFDNDFVDNKNGTITDNATGLMWQISGSPKPIMEHSIKKYISRLNKEKFSGYSDWRLPTLEELSSLLKKDNINGMHIDQVFYRKQKRCWSSTKPPEDMGLNDLQTRWIVNYKSGKIMRAKWFNTYMDSFYDSFVEMSYNYVKGVRSVK